MSRPASRRTPAARRTGVLWPVLWLLVFALDAVLTGRGRSHQMGAMGLGLLFATLVVTEALASRQED